MSQVIFDTIFTIFNLGVLILLFFLTYKFIRYVASKNKKKQN